MSHLGQLLFNLALQVSVPALVAILWSYRRRCTPGILLAAATGCILLVPLSFLPKPDPVSVGVTAEPIVESADSPTGPAQDDLSGGIDLLALFRAVRIDVANPPPPMWSAWTAAAWCALAIVAVSLLRFLIGYVQIRRAIRTARPVSLDRLPDRFHEMCEELGIRNRVTVFESDVVSSAATIGSIRPRILLGTMWPTWTADELEAVLAHELAHIAHRDSLGRWLMHSAVALHAYHPLMRWLSSRLEYLQELAADAVAARLTPNRENYLRSLASLALKTDAQTPGCVPTFLSRPRTLLRRIAMLRVKDDAQSGKLSRRRWAGYAVVAAALLTACGLRGTTPAALADEIKPARAEEAAKRPPLDLGLVTIVDQPNVAGYVSIRVGELARLKEMTMMVDMMTKVLKDPEHGLGVPINFELADVEQITGEVTFARDEKKENHKNSISMSLTSIRMAKDYDWANNLKVWFPSLETIEYHGDKYFAAETSPALKKMFPASKLYFYVADARTCVWKGDDFLKQMIDARKAGKTAPASFADWKAVESFDVGFHYVDVAKHAAPLMKTDDSQDAETKKILEITRPIAKDLETFSLGFNFSGRGAGRMQARFAGKEQAEEHEKNLRAILKMALAGAGEEPPIKQIIDGLKNARFRTEKNRLTVDADLGTYLLQAFGGTPMPGK